jgi:hypothetical protein
VLRRLARHAFTLLSALSLLLCVAVCGLWVRSYFACDWVTVHWQDPARFEATGGGVAALRGVLIVHYGHNAGGFGDGSDPGPVYRFDSQPVGRQGMFPPRVPPGETLAGFGWRRRPIGLRTPRGSPAHPEYVETRAQVPAWAMALLLAVLPLVEALRLIGTRRRARIGLCPGCGYDLRAHAAGGRCPECGTAIARSCRRRTRTR